jgi:hypothetical protein
MSRRVWRGSGATWLWAAAWLLLVAGCDELDEFRTRPGEVFHGRVIGSDSEQDEPSFIREGFPSFTQMDLTFDPSRAGATSELDQPREPAGTLETYLCPEEEDACPERRRTAGHFVESALEPIAPLTHDVLSQYDFPGGRLRNYILSARFDGLTVLGNVERSALVFASMMENGAVEVRVVAPSVRQDGADLLPALFGVFVLERRAR